MKFNITGYKKNLNTFQIKELNDTMNTNNNLQCFKMKTLRPMSKRIHTL